LFGCGHFTNHLDTNDLRHFARRYKAAATAKYGRCYFLPFSSEVTIQSLLYSLPQLPPFFHHHPSKNFKTSTLLLPKPAGTRRKGSFLVLPLGQNGAVDKVAIYRGGYCCQE